MRAIQVRRYGGPEVLEVAELEPPAPGPGQVLVAVSAAGVNYIDVYTRSGSSGYAPQLPCILGTEGAGRVIAAGEGVDTVQVGDRVAWKSARGSYAEQVAVDAREAVAIPDPVTDEVAAASMLQGLTAHYLCTSTYPVGPDDTALVHAAAGGVGLLLTQIVKLRGGRVIATVSTGEKETLAREAGADEVIRYDTTSVSDAVRDLTGGAGVAVVYDGVGQATFEGSLSSLRQRGCLVLYGAASGPVPPFDLQRLNPAGSLFVTRPTLVHYASRREELLGRCDELFGWIVSGQLTVRIGGRHPLADASRAHLDLEARRTTGKLLLMP